MLQNECWEAMPEEPRHKDTALQMVRQIKLFLRRCSGIKYIFLTIIICNNPFTQQVLFI